MVQVRIVEYKTCLNQDIVEQFLNYEKIKLTDVQWGILKSKVIAFERRLCHLYNRILSTATVELTIDGSIPAIDKEKYVQHLIDENMAIGPLIKIIEVQEHLILYEAGEQFVDSAFVLMLFLFIYDLLFSHTAKELDQEEQKELLIDNINRYLSYVQHLSTFKFTKLAPILSNKELESMFSTEIFKENKEMLLLCRDGIEMILQKYLQNSFFLEGEGQFIVTEQLYPDQMSGYIKTLIRNHKLPGKFLDIISIKFLQNATYQVCYSFGYKMDKQSDFVHCIKVFIKECLQLLIYKGNSKDFFKKINQFILEEAHVA